MAVALCAALAAAGWLLLRGDETEQEPAARNDEQSQATRPPPSETPPGPPAATPTEEPTGSPSGADARVPPAGYEDAVDEEGFALYVPTGWARTFDGVSVFYTASDERRQIQVFPLSEPTPYDSSLTAREEASGNPAFELLAFESLGPGPLDPVELEYVYDDVDEGPRHVLDHRFVAADGTLYALVVYGVPDDLAAQHAVQDQALASFCTTDCPAPD